MSKSKPNPAALQTQKSWAAPVSYWEEAWLRKKERHANDRHSKSLTDEDLDEFKACLELGFRFDSPDMEHDQRLSDTLPALRLYYAINKTKNGTVSKSSSSSSLVITTSSETETDTSLSSSPVDSPYATMFARGQDPKTLKTRLRHWAQLVACSAKHLRRD